MAHLVADVVSHVVSQLGQQRVQHSGLAEHHALGVGEVLGGAALDDVGGQSEGGADEAKHGGLVAHSLAQLLQGLPHEGACLLAVELCHLVHLLWAQGAGWSVHWSTQQVHGLQP
jgi:hypothetical protein